MNSDDLEFVAASTNAGFFSNVGDTRRQGIDLALGGKEGAFDWRVAYSFVDATYQSSFEVNAEANTTADADGNIVVHRRRSHSADSAAHRPPHRRLRHHAALEHRRADDRIVGRVPARQREQREPCRRHERAGHDDARHRPVAGLRRLQPADDVPRRRRTSISSRASSNVFDREYATAGFLTTNAFNPDGSFKPDPDDWTHENAISPAAPRAVWGGVRLRFD